MRQDATAASGLTGKKGSKASVMNIDIEPTAAARMSNETEMRKPPISLTTAMSPSKAPLTTPKITA